MKELLGGLLGVVIALIICVVVGVIMLFGSYALKQIGIWVF